MSFIQLIQLEQELINLELKLTNEFNALFENTMGEYYPDMFAFAIASRTLKQIKGFRNLIKGLSYECAIEILRAQFDTAMRFHGLWLCKEGMHKYTETFINPHGKFKDLKSIDNKSLTDAYLSLQLDAAYPKLKQIYDHGHGYVHLSEKYLMTCTKMESDEHGNYVFIGTLTSNNTVDENYFFSAIQSFLAITDVIRIEIKKYFENRKYFDDNLRVLIKSIEATM